MPTRSLLSFNETGAAVEISLLPGSLAGVWDALVDGRADLAVGAVADVCPPGRFETRALGRIDHLLVVAPGHPLARFERPMSAETLRAYPLVVLADSARSLPRRSLGITDPPRRLVVTNMSDKRAALAAGLGVGHLPVFWARAMLDSAELVALETEQPVPVVQWLLAWHRGQEGRARRWFAKAIEEGFDPSSIQAP